MRRPRNETCNGISKQELNDMLKRATMPQFQEAKKVNLKLNMARGKPQQPQLDDEHGPVGVSRGLYAGGSVQMQGITAF